jgi:hypothetical protein
VLRIRPSLKAALEILAAAERRTLNRCIEIVLEAHIEAVEKRQQRKTSRS